MRILLDTSAYSALLRGHEAVVNAVQKSDRITVNAIVLGELLAGFRRGARYERNIEQLRSFLDSARTSVAAVGEETASRYSTIVTSLRIAGTPIPTNDIWIAATAMQYGLRLVTTDRHFERVVQVEVDLFDPMT